jgi:uncharacterized membrane protein HdeD (DUF308 family)
MKDAPLIIEVLPGQIKGSWRWVLGMGLILVVLGTIGLGALVVLTLASILLLGVFLMIAGLVQFIDALKSKRHKGTILRTSIALLYIIGGGIVVYDPLLATSIVTVLLAWILIVIGITRIAMAVTHRDTQIWGWLLFAGLCSLVLGILILMQLPISVLWVIGLFIAVELIINGWSYIFISLSMRKK